MSALADLRALVEQPDTATPEGRLISTYRSACLAAPIDLSAREEVRQELAQIEAIRSLEDLVRQMVAQRLIGSGTFFRVGLEIDPVDASRYGLSIDQGGVELPDVDSYADPSSPLMKDYREHADNLSRIVKGSAIDVDAALRVETALAAAALSADERRDPVGLYHPLSAAEIAAQAPAFPWGVLWQGLGLLSSGKINVRVPGHLAAIERLFSATPLSDLKAYMAWQLIQDQSPRLDQDVLNADFAFWSRFSGQVVPPSREWTCFTSTLDWFDQAIAQQYMARSYDETRSAETSALAQELSVAFQGRLEKAAWLDDATRAEALAKLSKLSFRVGHPDHWSTLEGLDLRGSYLAQGSAFRRFFIAKEQSLQRVDRAEWNVSVLDVNAYYSARGNSVTIPGIFLAPPFFVPGASRAAQLGALGSVVGHELTHAFDAVGRDFDGDGNLRDWWSLAAAERFRARAECVVDEFNALEYLPGKTVNGALTLGENLADLGGLQLALDVLQRAPTGQAGDGFNEAQIFFLSYAQAACENVRPELLESLAHSDGHAPSKLRVNGSLQNIPAFAEAFQCASSSPMVAHPRCEVW